MLKKASRLIRLVYSKHYCIFNAKIVIGLFIKISQENARLWQFVILFGVKLYTTVIVNSLRCVYCLFWSTNEFIKTNCNTTQLVAIQLSRHACLAIVCCPCYSLFNYSFNLYRFLLNFFIWLRNCSDAELLITYLLHYLRIK